MYTFRLTALTSLNITGDMKLIDVNGNSHEFTSYHVHMMMIVGWVCFIIAWILNIVYYFLHPSAVDFELSRLHEKLKIPVFGNYIWDISKTLRIDMKTKATSEDPSLSMKKAKIEEEVKVSIPQVIIDKDSNTQSPISIETDQIPHFIDEQNNSKGLIPIRKEINSETMPPVAMKKGKTDVFAGNNVINVSRKLGLDEITPVIDEQNDSRDFIPIRKKKSKTIHPVAVKKDKTDVFTGKNETNVLQEFGLDDVDEEDSVTYV